MISKSVNSKQANAEKNKEKIDITLKNLINKYNNSIYESEEDEEYQIFLEMYSAS
jgi:hypothetical protein